MGLGIHVCVSCKEVSSDISKSRMSVTLTNVDGTESRRPLRPRFRDLLPTLHEDHPTVQVDLGLRTRGPACLQINQGGVVRVMWGPRELSTHIVTSTSELHLTMSNIVCCAVWKQRGEEHAPSGVNWCLLTDANHGLPTRCDVMVYLCESGRYRELGLEYVNQKDVARVKVARQGTIDMQPDGRTVFTWKTKVEADQAVTSFEELRSSGPSWMSCAATCARERLAVPLE